MTPSVSIVISSFEYARFLRAAIDSALAQLDAEVIVVDDGSRDSSPELIGGYGDRLLATHKQNGGQASALNAGFARSRGETILFLDADDVLLPGAAEAVAAALGDGAWAKAHWPMPVIDAAGERTGAVQDAELPAGELREAIVAGGPLGEAAIGSPPMSGNAFPRRLLERLMPIPEDPYRTGADEYLFALAPVFGPVRLLAPQSLYRLHGGNDHLGRDFEAMLAFQRRHDEIVSARAAGILGEQGLRADPAAWRRAAWWARAERTAETIARAVPERATVALLDEEALGVGAQLRGRTIVPFPERGGVFAGPPADDAEAGAALERLRAGHIAVAWTAFWWLEEYPSLARGLAARWRRVAEEPDVIVLAREEAA